MLEKKYDFAVFPGDFNPFHYGHINVLVKASQYVNKAKENLALFEDCDTKTLLMDLADYIIKRKE